jgi:hypothetical protein
MDSLSLLCHATLVMDKPYFTNKPDRFKHQGLLAQDRPVINVRVTAFGLRVLKAQGDAAGAVREPPIEGKELQYPRIKPYRTGWDNPYLLKVLQG